MKHTTGTRHVTRDILFQTSQLYETTWPWFSRFGDKTQKINNPNTQKHRHICYLSSSTVRAAHFVKVKYTINKISAIYNEILHFFTHFGTFRANCAALRMFFRKAQSLCSKIRVFLEFYFYPLEKRIWNAHLTSFLKLKKSWCDITSQLGIARVKNKIYFK